MAKVVLTREARQADRIIRSLPKQSIVGAQLGMNKSTTSYRVREVYPTMLVEAIKLIELAGYEVKEKE